MLLTVSSLVPHASHQLDSCPVVGTLGIKLHIRRRVCQ